MKTNNEDFSRFTLSDEQLGVAKSMIKALLTNDKTPCDNPLAIVVGGQPGAGKSGLIAHSAKAFNDGNVIIVENDDFRCFHPKIKEIQEKHPDMYTLLTEQLGLGLLPGLLEELIAEGYNMILHQTLKNNRIADDAMTKLANRGYTVVLNTLAVSKLESMSSMVSRWIGQIKTKGYGRPVETVNHHTAYDGLPGTVEYIEDNNKAHLVQVFLRGEDPSKPKVVYSKFNEETKKETFKQLAGRETMPVKNFNIGFSTAKDAVIKGREMCAEKTAKVLPERIKAYKSSPHSSEAVHEQINVLQAELNDYKNSTECSCSR